MIGVYGLGNVLQKDDGFGPSAVRHLEARFVFPESVVLKDLGTPGLDLASHIVDLEALVFLDTVKLDEPPGTIRVLRKDEILASDVLGLRGGTHEAGVREGLMTAELTGRCPQDVCLIGVVPLDLDTGTGLSPPVAAALEPFLETTLRELARLGCRPVPRREGERPPTGAWWEA